MAFTLFTPLFQKIDHVTATFVADISARSIAAITPVASAGLTLAFVVYGLLIIRGAVEMPVADFLGRALRIGLLVSIALTGGLYQQEIAGAITTVPDDLAQALMSDPAQGGSAAALVDQAAGHGFDRASEAFAKASFFSTDGFIYAVFGTIILLATGILTAIGGAFLLIAKIALALLAGIGPLFIIALLFQPTHRFFEQWVAQVLNYAILIVLFGAVFGLLMQIFGDYMGDLRFDGVQNVSYALGGAIILSLASVVILLQLPSIASGLAGGVGLGYLWKLRTVRGGAASAYRSSRGAYRAAQAASGRVATAATGARTIATSAASSSASIGRAAAGYFKGRRAG